VKIKQVKIPNQEKVINKKAKQNQVINIDCQTK
jgi:hypothetical protein